MIPSRSCCDTVGRPSLDWHGKLGHGNSWTGERAVKAISAQTVVRPGEHIAGSDTAALTGERTVHVDERRSLSLSVSCVSVGRQYLGRGCWEKTKGGSDFVQGGKENLSKTCCLSPAKVRPEALMGSCCDVPARDMRPPSQNEEGKHDHLHSSASRSAGNSGARLGEQGWQADQGPLQAGSTWLTRVLSQFMGQ